MKANFTEVIINAEISSFGVIENKYSNIKVLLNECDKEVDISPMLQDENNEEAVYITLNKEQCVLLASVLKAYAKSI